MIERRPISFSGRWTPDAVRDRLAEAALALKTAAVGRSAPLDVWTKWPAAIVHDHNEAYGYDEAKAKPHRSSPAAISRMDETLSWVSRWLSREQCVRYGLADDAQAVLWLRATGRSWAWIGRARHEGWAAEKRRPPRGNSRPVLQEIEARALRFLANECNLARVEYREARELPDHGRRDASEKYADEASG